MPPIEQLIKFTAEFDIKNISSMSKMITHLKKLKETHAITNKQYAESMKMIEGEDRATFKVTQQILKYEARQKKLNLAKKQDVMQSIKMRGAYLGLMFAGLALWRIFGGIARSMFDLLGASKVWHAAMISILLPTFGPLTQKTNEFLIHLMNMPTTTKKVVGAIVILAGALSLLMLSVGFFNNLFRVIDALFGTAIISNIVKSGGFIKWFFGLFASLWDYLVGAIYYIASYIAEFATAIGVGFSTAAAIIAGVIVAIVALVIGAVAAWKNNFLGFKDAVIGIWTAIKTTISGFVDFFRGIWEVIVGIFTLNGDKISQGFKLIGKGIMNFFIGIANFVINLINALVGLIIAALAQLIRPIEWIWNKIPGHAKVTWYEDIMSGGAGKSLIPSIPSFQTGGIMPYTGLAMLHAGETVIPTGQTQTSNSSNANIVVNANVSSDYDVRRLADQLSKYWVTDFERISKARGSI